MMTICNSSRVGYRGALFVFVCTSWANVIAQDRMPAIPSDRLTAAQERAVAEFAAARGEAVFGPFVPLLRSPEVMTRVRLLGDYLRFNSRLPPNLSELAILITARQWTQQYEWGLHQPIALKAGLDSEIAKAIAEGRRPENMTKDEAVVYDLCTELSVNRSVSDHTYARAVSAFGEQGVIDAVGIVGYYTTLSMVLNTARTPPPASAPSLASYPK